MKLFFAFPLLIACGAGQKDVAVQGSDLDIARVVGDWKGEYNGADSGRSGEVSFSLQMGSHTAEGQVFMGGATPLKIAFVKVDQDEVKGTIAPYTDPACACEVQTTFLGTMLGNNVINGTFESKLGTTGKVQGGTWSVKRQN